MAPGDQRQTWWTSRPGHGALNKTNRKVIARGQEALQQKAPGKDKVEKVLSQSAAKLGAP